jgi:DNA-directed RNA polymerase subunit F
MPAFIKLKDEDETEVAVNINMITKILPGSDDELTSVYLVDEEDPLEVQESMEEILAKVKAAS